jgi:hypothetical protein
MLEQGSKDITARLRATIEEELGRLRHFADLPATELEEMAARLVRAITPHVTEVAHRNLANRAA